jgi:hypothetical protein
MINRGANGIVELITHIESGEKYVWKEIPIMEGEEEKVKKEVRIAMSVKSEFLVPIVDWFAEEERFYIVMPLYEKGTLSTLFADLKKSGKPIEEPVFLFFFIIFPLLFIFSRFFYFFCCFLARMPDYWGISEWTACSSWPQHHPSRPEIGQHLCDERWARENWRFRFVEGNGQFIWESWIVLWNPVLFLLPFFLYLLLYFRSLFFHLFYKLTEDMLRQK